jgi:DNA-binding NarL/FixJ family response regulator
MITLAITDDNDLLRRNIIDRLKDEFHIVFEAAMAKSLLRFLRTHPPVDHPQIILMDIEMDEMDGIEATSQVKLINAAIKVIMLTVFEQEEKVLNAIKAGAVGYLIKDEKKEKMIECIQDVANGGSYLSSHSGHKGLTIYTELYTQGICPR